MEMIRHEAKGVNFNLILEIPCNLGKKVAIIASFQENACLVVSPIVDMVEMIRKEWITTRHRSPMVRWCGKGNLHFPEGQAQFPESENEVARLLFPQDPGISM